MHYESFPWLTYMKMRENNILDPAVHLNEMASMTKNYTGAEIAGVVKAASSYAFSRHIKVSHLKFLFLI
jgi:SpoVK/Ycf46/Vps4 family AAA+-type ATPase